MTENYDPEGADWTSMGIIGHACEIEIDRKKVNHYRWRPRDPMSDEGHGPWTKGHPDDRKDAVIDKVYLAMKALQELHSDPALTDQDRTIVMIANDTLFALSPVMKQRSDFIASLAKHGEQDG